MKYQEDWQRLSVLLQGEEMEELGLQLLPNLDKTDTKRIKSLVAIFSSLSRADQEAIIRMAEGLQATDIG